MILTKSSRKKLLNIYKYEIKRMSQKHSYPQYNTPAAGAQPLLGGAVAEERDAVR